MKLDLVKTEILVPWKGYKSLSNLTSNDYLELSDQFNLIFRNITIKNVGNSNSPSCALRFYLSIDSDFDENMDAVLRNSSINIPVINSGGSKTIATTHNIERTEVPSNYPYNNYELFLLIDVYNDNIYEINNVQYTTHRSPSLKKSLDEEKFTESTEYYSETIRVYDFSGNLIEEEKLHSETDRKTLIENLPRGIYILKHEDGSSERIAK